jgi:thiosulfate/3-mercaptopyruvate sulfurtransferase
MPNDPRKPFEEFQKEHIPGARFFDLDAICDLDSPYPHMLPTPRTFAQAMGITNQDKRFWRIGNLGITRSVHWISHLLAYEQNQVLVYDAQGMFSAPRVWWTLQVFGHRNVSVLNGGLPAWKRVGGALETGPPKEYKIRTYPVPEVDLRLVRSFEDMTALVEGGDKAVRIIDARSEDRLVTRLERSNYFQIPWSSTGASSRFGSVSTTTSYE